MSKVTKAAIEAMKAQEAFLKSPAYQRLLEEEKKRNRQNTIDALVQLSKDLNRSPFVDNTELIKKIWSNFSEQSK